MLLSTQVSGLLVEVRRSLDPTIGRVRSFSGRQNVRARIPQLRSLKGGVRRQDLKGGREGGGRGREGEEGKREVYTSEPIQHARVGGLDPETLNPLPEPRNKAPLYKSPESPTKPPGAPPPSPSPRAQEPKMAACSEKARGHVIAGSMTPSTTLRV